MILFSILPEIHVNEPEPVTNGQYEEQVQTSSGRKNAYIQSIRDEKSCHLNEIIGIRQQPS